MNVAQLLINTPHTFLRTFRRDEVVGASLGKGEADIQEMDGVLGKRAGCGRWGNKKLTHLGGLGR